MKWFIFLIASLFSFGLLADKKYQTGLIIPKDWKSKGKFESSIKRGFAAPAEFDWRTQKTLSPIMDQGQCGSCWDFSASATFRDDMIVQGGSLFKNSTQEVLDCNTQGYSCNGGFFDIDQFFVSPGVATESAYGPYQARQNSCKQVSKSSRAPGWAYVALNDSSKPSDAEIKAAIYKWGPVSVGVAADNAFSGYSGGVFTNCTSNQLNHAVQLVGWSDSGGYWIMRNSWGSSWGEQGYMRLKFGCNGIGEAANYFKFDSNPVPPSPTPGPTPGPTPNPDPTPVPPGPSPCDLPKASTRYPAQVKATKGRIYTVGTKAVVGETYLWTAVPAFNNGATPTDAVIGYKPAYTKTITITATNACGKASASSTFNIPNSKGMEVFD